MRSCALIYWQKVKVQKAVKKGQILDPHKQVSEITAEYNLRAVGPVASEVLERGLLDMLKKIPGPPRDVRVICRGSDRVKLSWDPPAHNPEAVEQYVVYKRAEDGCWEKAVRTDKTEVVVKGLKPSGVGSDIVGDVFEGRAPREYSLDRTLTYMFEINSIVTGCSAGSRCETLPSTAATTAYSLAAGAYTAFFCPF